MNEFLKRLAQAVSRRDGPEYVTAQDELRQIDERMLADKARRDQVVGTLDAIDADVAEAEQAYMQHRYGITADQPVAALPATEIPASDEPDEPDEAPALGTGAYLEAATGQSAANRHFWPFNGKA